MTFQITFAWPNDDWTWINVEANDFHQAMLVALDKCPLNCRVQKIEREPEGKTFGPLDSSVKQSI
jgi:hypothetical protein